ncbi:MAG TPA: hypothetical protein VKV24_19455 [Casimicrobiaceae bacterium]|nr:hypothetical protein [Casimicrobiaceae bacterium]
MHALKLGARQSSFWFLAARKRSIGSSCRVRAASAKAPQSQAAQDIMSAISDILDRLSGVEVIKERLRSTGERVEQ